MGAKRKRRPPAQPRETWPSAATRRRVGLLLFAASLAVRILFWRATPDAAWPHSAAFKGDAPVWTDYVQALRARAPFELGLPIHPPGTAHLLAFLWNGDPASTALPKIAWILLGSLSVVVIYGAALRSFGFGPAVVAGGFAAISTGLMVLSTSLNVETPYLFLTAVSLYLFEDVRAGRSLGRAALWAAANGIACLLRVEHGLFFALLLALLLALAMRSPEKRKETIPRLAAAVVFFLLPLVPWHVKAWKAIADFNDRPRVLTPVEESAVSGVEQSLAAMSWDSEAKSRRDSLPAFLRRTASAFVLATAAYRGGREVRGEDFKILEEAFGYFPRPLARHPFVSSYGPLNFALANHGGATGGFNRGPLEEPPLLAGGRERYPAFLVQGLPPERLTFVYPPHLRLYNDGYSIGWKWIAEHPGDFARLAGHKLSIFWSGAALGVTGYGLPMRLSGVRRSVDMVVPQGAIPAVWRLLILVLCLLGIAAGWRQVALWPWLLFLGSKLAVTVVFFGYARLGATVIPVVAVLLGLGAQRWLFPRLSPATRQRGAVIAGVVLVAAVAIEAARLVSRPTLILDGKRMGAVDPFPPHDNRGQSLEVTAVAPKAPPL